MRGFILVVYYNLSLYLTLLLSDANRQFSCLKFFLHKTGMVSQLPENGRRYEIEKVL